MTNVLAVAEGIMALLLRDVEKRGTNPILSFML
jgi:hypothetical protein